MPAQYHILHQIHFGLQNLQERWEACKQENQEFGENLTADKKNKSWLIIHNVIINQLLLYDLKYKHTS